MAVKILLTWDIRPGMEQDYFEFTVREFIPGVQRLGLEPNDAWFTMYGDYPQIMAAIVAPNIRTVQRVLHSEAWQELINRLGEYVENLDYKVVPARSGFQL